MGDGERCLSVYVHVCVLLPLNFSVKIPEGKINSISSAGMLYPL